MALCGWADVDNQDAVDALRVKAGALWLCWGKGGVPVSVVSLRAEAADGAERAAALAVFHGDLRGAVAVLQVGKLCEVPSIFGGYAVRRAPGCCFVGG